MCQEIFALKSPAAASEGITGWRLASLVEPMVLLAETRPIGRVSSATSPLNITGPVNFVPTYSYG